jgi:hypothetical protein
MEEASAGNVFMDLPGDARGHGVCVWPWGLRVAMGSACVCLWLSQGTWSWGPCVFMDLTGDVVMGSMVHVAGRPRIRRHPADHTDVSLSLYSHSTYVALGAVSHQMT